MIEIDEERARHWLEHGAQPTRTVATLLRTKGIEARAPSPAPRMREPGRVPRPRAGRRSGRGPGRGGRGGRRPRARGPVADGDLGRRDRPRRTGRERDPHGRQGRGDRARRGGHGRDRRGRLTRGCSLRIDVFTLFPEWFDWFEGQRHVRNALERGSELRLLQLPRHDPAQRRPGRRRALRRRRRDGAARRRRRRGAARRLRRRPRRRRVILLAPSGRPLDDALADRARGRAAPGAALRALRGRRRAGPRAPRRRRDLDRPLRALGRRAGGDGRRRRRDAQAPGRARARRQRASRSRSPRRSAARPSTRTTRARRATAGWEVPEVLLSGDHARVREWRLERSAAAQAGTPSRRLDRRLASELSTI